MLVMVEEESKQSWGYGCSHPRAEGDKKGQKYEKVQEVKPHKLNKGREMKSCLGVTR